MGVDFFPCTYCDETYADCGYYFSCDCGTSYCSNKCGSHRENEAGESTCRICRHEYVTDYYLVDFLLKTVCLNREEATKLYYDSIEKKTKDK